MSMITFIIGCSIGMMIGRSEKDKYKWILYGGATALSLECLFKNNRPNEIVQSFQITNKN